MTRLPNLELLMYKAIEHLKQDEEFCKKCEGLPNYGHKRVNFTIETFPQIWGAPVQDLMLQRTEGMLSVAMP